MKKHLSALIAALLITSVIGFGIFTIGVNALTNKNTVPLQNAPASAASSSSTGSSTTADPAATTNVQQLQQEVSTLQSQLNQDNQVLQQYQSLIQVLQQQGLIVIDQNGNIYIPRGSFR
jgi:peptidoglycan hydrolase CwlO-like protein